MPKDHVYPDDLAEEVLLESGRWVSPWYPPGARVTQLDDVRLYLLGDKAVLIDADHARTARDLVATCGAAAGALGARELEITTGPGLVHGVTAQELTDFGARVVEVVDILGVRPTSSVISAIDVPDTVSTAHVHDRGQVEQFTITANSAWGYDPPRAEEVDKAHRDLEPGSFLAFHEGSPAGTGGYSLVGTAARFWGAAVLEDSRHRGVYRALVRARLDDCARRGARLALVHAAPASSPILRSLGFSRYGNRVTSILEV